MRRLPALALALALAGCGGDGSSPRSADDRLRDQLPLNRTERGVSERRTETRSLPREDRVAYYQLATASGLARARAASALERSPGTTRAGDVEAAEKRVTLLRPRDGRLARARRLVLGALAIGKAQNLSTGAARRVTAATDAVNRELVGYTRRNPAAAALVPE